jgi:hypothetical protein
VGLQLVDAQRSPWRVLHVAPRSEVSSPAILDHARSATLGELEAYEAVGDIVVRTDLELLHTEVRTSERRVSQMAPPSPHVLRCSWDPERREMLIVGQGANVAALARMLDLVDRASAE